MSSDVAAIRPTSQLLSDEELDLEEEVMEKTEARKDQSLKDLLHHEGFGHVRTRLEEIISEYRTHQRMKIDIKDTLEEIGKKTVISDVVASELEGVLAWVDSAASIESDG